MKKFRSSGLDEIRAHRPYQNLSLGRLWGLSGFQCAGLTCCVITRYRAFAIVGRFPLYSAKPASLEMNIKLPGKQYFS